MTKNEALKMAIDYLDGSYEAHKVRKACKEALEQPAQEPVAYIQASEINYIKAMKEEGIKEWRTCLGMKHEAGDVALYAHPAQEPKCSEHPDAPHGFCRNASHSADRYVCECEGWEAEQPAQEPVARIEVYNLLTKNGGFAITKEWLWSIRYVNSKGIVNIFPNEYPAEKKYAVQSAKYWAKFLNCSIVEVDTRG